MQAWLKRQGGIIQPVVLLDIQTSDGTQYFWSDVEGTYLSEITGVNQFYNGWIKSVDAFQLTKDLSTNAGSVTMQNISGNTIDRDVAGALKAHEFEGALCILRLWLPVFDAAMDEFHGYISEQTPGEDEFTFRHLQLFDPAQYDVADDVISDMCTWRFKSPQCGSTGSATVCDFRLSTCQDAQHLAQERFNGVLSIVPTAAISAPSVGPGGGGDRPQPPPRGPRAPNLN
jgi:phage-related protein